MIRAIVRAAINKHGMRVIGIRNGFDGLIWPEGAKEMTEETVSGILPRGGTILGTTNRGNPFAYKASENGKEVIHDYSSLCMDNARRLGIAAIIVMGGDGTNISRAIFRARASTLRASPRQLTMTWTPRRPHSASTRPSSSLQKQSTACTRRQRVTIA